MRIGRYRGVTGVCTTLVECMCIDILVGTGNGVCSTLVGGTGGGAKTSGLGHGIVLGFS